MEESKRKSVPSMQERLRHAGKPFKVAIVACVHKLLTILDAMMRKQTFWQPPIAA